MRDTAMERLARENPVSEPIPGPPIEPLLRRLDEQPVIAADRSFASARGQRLTASAVVPGLAAAVALAVAGVVLISLGHDRAPASASSTVGASRSVRPLALQLAILRRPQTARDRTFPSSEVRSFDSMPEHRRIVPRLTRLAASLKTRSGAGDARVYVIVLGRTTHGSEQPANEYAAWSITISDRGANATAGLTASELAHPQQTPGTVPAVAVVASGNGINQSLVSDRVARVRWVFSGRSPDGRRLRGPVTIYPTVRHNVAIAPLTRREGLLSAATWYDASGLAIANWTSPQQSRQPVVHAVPADLLRSFAAFRRPRTSRDVMSTRCCDRKSAEQQYGMDPSLSRFVVSTASISRFPTQKLYIAPGVGYLCMMVAQGLGGGIGCVADHSAETRGIVQGIFGRHGGIDFGVLPDGVTNARVTDKHGLGGSRTVKINAAGGFVLSIKPPQTFSYVGTDGALVTDPAPPWHHLSIQRQTKRAGQKAR